MLNKSEVLRKLIEEYDVKTTKDVQEMNTEVIKLNLILERLN